MDTVDFASAYFGPGWDMPDFSNYVGDLPKIEPTEECDFCREKKFDLKKTYGNRKICPDCIKTK